MAEFAHYDLELLNPSFDSPLVDVLNELEYLRVEPGLSKDLALEHASIMLDSVRRLTMVAAMESDGSLVWAAHYLSTMAKALVDDADLKMQRGA